MGQSPPNFLTPNLYSSGTQDSVSSPGSKCPFMSASPIVTKSSSSSRDERVPVPIAPDPSGLWRRGQHLCRGQTVRSAHQRVKVQPTARDRQEGCFGDKNSKMAKDKKRSQCLENGSILNCLPHTSHRLSPQTRQCNFIVGHFVR